LLSSGGLQRSAIFFWTSLVGIKQVLDLVENESGDKVAVTT